MSRLWLLTCLQQLSTGKASPAKDKPVNGSYGLDTFESYQKMSDDETLSQLLEMAELVNIMNGENLDTIITGSSFIPWLENRNYNSSQEWNLKTRQQQADQWIGWMRCLAQIIRRENNI